MNPIGTGLPLQTHPSASASIPGYLQEAPYSFRTVTGALAWLNAFPATPVTNRRLPWTYPESERSIQYVVIHCLPGLYGPNDNGPGEVDPASGLVFNGETFPIVLPERVGIQGTSALDTIFDARRLPDTTVFQVGYFNPDHGHEFEYTFIDSITIRGARGGLMPRSGVGVLIQLETPVRMSISNCFITDNVVGVAVLQDDPDFIHEPILCNNTFAWNQVGLYNAEPGAIPVTGTNVLRVINNIFDTSLPTTADSAHVTPVSAFEGVDVVDRLVTQRGLTIFVPAPDFNVFEVVAGQFTRTNRGDLPGAVLYSWPRTATRNGPGAQAYSPRYRLEQITQAPTTAVGRSPNRQVLYIQDVFRVDPGLPTICTHDFRLAPTARSGGGNGTPIQNPLIDLGIDFGFDASGNTLHALVPGIIFANGLAITQSPGLPFAADLPAYINAWDFDCDGFGNRRVSRHRFGPATSIGRADIGADECHNVTVSGYVDSTRIFSRAHAAVASNTGGIGTRDSVYLFHVNGAVAGNVYERPQFNFSADIVDNSTHNRLVSLGSSGIEWYNQATAGVAGRPPHPYGGGTGGGAGNYTDGQFDDRSQSLSNVRWAATRTAGLPFFMRNLMCDFAPHTLHDTVPSSNLNQWPMWWGEHFWLSPAVLYKPYFGYEDIFKSNPYFISSPLPVALFYDNPMLYHQSGAGLADKRTQAGHVHPPATVLQNMLVPATNQMLMQNSLHPILLWEWGSATFLYTINSYGRSANPDPIPYVTPWHGIRVNLERLVPDDGYWGNQDNNLQTFLAVQGDGAAPTLLAPNSAEQRSRLATDARYAYPRPADYRKQIQDVLKERR